MSSVLSQGEVDALLKGISGGEFDCENDYDHDDYSYLITLENTKDIIKRLSKQKHYSPTFKKLFKQSQKILFGDDLTDRVENIQSLAIDFLYHAGMRDIYDYADNNLWPKEKEKSLLDFCIRLKEKKFHNLADNYIRRRTVDWETTWMYEEMMHWIENGVANRLKYTIPTPEYMFRYKIRRKSDGLFVDLKEFSYARRGTGNVAFNERGRAFRKIADIKSHITSAKYTPYKSKTEDFEIIKYRLREENITDLTEII